MELSKEECEELEYEHKQDMIREAVADANDEAFRQFVDTDKQDLMKEFVKDYPEEFEEYKQDLMEEFVKDYPEEFEGYCRQAWDSVRD